MLVFCEECGEKMEIILDHKNANVRHLRCRGCGELLTICDNGHTAKLESPENPEDDIPKFSLSEKYTKDMESQKVLVVDDSSLIRRAIRRIFEGNSRLEIVGEAANGAEALDLISQVNPDVVTLDVNMPVMDGLTTLKHMMIKNPKPAVMISTLTREGASVTFDALKYGAVDFIPKPSQISGKSLEDQHEKIIRKISLAAQVETIAIQYLRSSEHEKGPLEDNGLPAERIFALGASEGGYSSLLKIIPLLRPKIHAAFLVILYAEPMYIDAFARYLNEHSMIRVLRARHGEPIQSGACYLCSGEEYLTIEKSGGIYFLRVNPNPFPNRRGAINMLMMSLAETLKEKSAGAILSGSGFDGLEGLREILRHGGTGIVQHPKTCLCKEMPIFVLTNLNVRNIILDREIATRINQMNTQ